MSEAKAAAAVLLTALNLSTKEGYGEDLIVRVIDSPHVNPSAVPREVLVIGGATQVQLPAGGFVVIVPASSDLFTRDDLGEPQDPAVDPNIAHLELIARTCHEVNRAYCAALGDLSQLPWDEAPEWQRESALAGVKFIIANPDAAPSASHDSWLKQKAADGWKYGPVKDAEAKVHPCFVPYEELPAEQRAKDFIFGATVRSMAGLPPRGVGESVDNSSAPAGVASGQLDGPGS